MGGKNSQPANKDTIDQLQGLRNTLAETERALATEREARGAMEAQYLSSKRSYEEMTSQLTECRASSAKTQADNDKALATEREAQKAQYQEMKRQLDECHATYADYAVLQQQLRERSAPSLPVGPTLTADDTFSAAIRRLWPTVKRSKGQYFTVGDPRNRTMWVSQGLNRPMLSAKTTRPEFTLLLQFADLDDNTNSFTLEAHELTSPSSVVGTVGTVGVQTVSPTPKLVEGQTTIPITRVVGTGLTGVIWSQAVPVGVQTVSPTPTLVAGQTTIPINRVVGTVDTTGGPGPAGVIWSQAVPVGVQTVSPPTSRLVEGQTTIPIVSPQTLTRVGYVGMGMDNVMSIFPSSTGQRWQLTPLGNGVVLWKMNTKGERSTLLYHNAPVNPREGTVNPSMARGLSTIQNEEWSALGLSDVRLDPIVGDMIAWRLDF